MRVLDIMQRDVLTIEESLDLSAALQIMIYHEIRHLPVLRQDRLVGLLSERDILSARPKGESLFHLEGSVGSVMARAVETIHPGAEIEEAAARMAIDKLGCLPVVEGERLMGLITRADVLGALAQCRVQLPESGDVAVGDLMTRKLVAVHADDPVSDAAAMMVRAGVRHLPVVDGMKRVIGIVSDRDIRSVVGNPLESVEREPASRKLQALRVQDIMTPQPHTVHAEDPAALAAGALVDEPIGALPVVDEQECLVGMISYVDVLRRARPWLEHPQRP